MSTGTETGPSGRTLAWLRSTGHEPESWDALPGDVSPRRYFRLHLADGRRVIVAVYPSSVADACARFLTTSSLLTEARIPIPAVLASDCDRGLMVLEDVGEETLFDRRARDWTHLEPWLAKGVELARRIAEIDTQKLEGLNPPLDRDLLERELEKTWRVFLVPAGITPDTEPGRALAQAFGDVASRLVASPLVACHRDFMARNLVPQADGSLVVLDHQDLRLGPVGYDLASLTNDSLFPPPELIAKLLAGRGDGAPSLEQVELAALQRTFKAIGTFAEFAGRGSARHLPLIRPTLVRALELLETRFGDLPLDALRRSLAHWLSPLSESIC